jgi:hypothetical protein
VWPRYRSLDWGFYPGYTAVGWYAIDDLGCVWKYRELYVQKTNPPDVGKMIAEMSEGEDIVATFADSSIWVKDQYGREISVNGNVHDYKPGTSHSIQQEIEAAGNFSLTQAINSRIAGWTRLKTLLYHDAEHKAGWMVSEECPHTIRVYPEQQFNMGAGDPEDMDTEGEDHIPDGDRYFAMGADVSGRVPAENSGYRSEIERLLREQIKKADPRDSQIPSMDMEGDLMEYNNNQVTEDEDV